MLLRIVSCIIIATSANAFAKTWVRGDQFVINDKKLDSTQKILTDNTTGIELAKCDLNIDQNTHNLTRNSLQGQDNTTTEKTILCAHTTQYTNACWIENTQKQNGIYSANICGIYDDTTRCKNLQTKIEDTDGKSESVTFLSQSQIFKLKLETFSESNTGYLGSTGVSTECHDINSVNGAGYVFMKEAITNNRTCEAAANEQLSSKCQPATLCPCNLECQQNNFIPKTTSTEWTSASQEVKQCYQCNQDARKAKFYCDRHVACLNTDIRTYFTANKSKINASYGPGAYLCGYIGDTRCGCQKIPLDSGPRYYPRIARNDIGNSTDCDATMVKTNPTCNLFLFSPTVRPFRDKDVKPKNNPCAQTLNSELGYDIRGTFFRPKIIVQFGSNEKSIQFGQDINPTDLKGVTGSDFNNNIKHPYSLSQLNSAATSAKQGAMILVTPWNTTIHTIIYGIQNPQKKCETTYTSSRSAFIATRIEYDLRNDKRSLVAYEVVPLNKTPQNTASISVENDVYGNIKSFITDTTQIPFTSYNNKSFRYIYDTKDPDKTKVINTSTNKYLKFIRLGSVATPPLKYKYDDDGDVMSPIQIRSLPGYNVDETDQLYKFSIGITPSILGNSIFGQEFSKFEKLLPDIYDKSIKIIKLSMSKDTLNDIRSGAKTISSNGCTFLYANKYCASLDRCQQLFNFNTSQYLKTPKTNLADCKNSQDLLTELMCLIPSMLVSQCNAYMGCSPHDTSMAICKNNPRSPDVLITCNPNKNDDTDCSGTNKDAILTDYKMNTDFRTKRFACVNTGFVMAEIGDGSNTRLYGNFGDPVQDYIPALARQNGSIFPNTIARPITTRGLDTYESPAYYVDEPKNIIKSDISYFTAQDTSSILKRMQNIKLIDKFNNPTSTNLFSSYFPECNNSIDACKNKITVRAREQREFQNPSFCQELESGTITNTWTSIKSRRMAQYRNYMNHDYTIHMPLRCQLMDVTLRGAGGGAMVDTHRYGGDGDNMMCVSIGSALNPNEISRFSSTGGGSGLVSATIDINKMTDFQGHMNVHLGQRTSKCNMRFNRNWNLASFVMQPMLLLWNTMVNLVTLTNQFLQSIGVASNHKNSIDAFYTSKFYNNQLDSLTLESTINLNDSNALNTGHIAANGNTVLKNTLNATSLPPNGGGLTKLELDLQCKASAGGGVIGGVSDIRYAGGCSMYGSEIERLWSDALSQPAISAVLNGSLSGLSALGVDNIFDQKVNFISINRRNIKIDVGDTKLSYTPKPRSSNDILWKPEIIAAGYKGLSPFDILASGNVDDTPFADLPSSPIDGDLGQAHNIQSTQGKPYTSNATYVVNRITFSDGVFSRVSGKNDEMWADGSLCPYNGSSYEPTCQYLPIFATYDPFDEGNNGFMPQYEREYKNTYRYNVYLKNQDPKYYGSAGAMFAGGDSYKNGRVAGGGGPGFFEIKPSDVITTLTSNGIRVPTLDNDGQKTHCYKSTTNLNCVQDPQCKVQCPPINVKYKNILVPLPINGNTVPQTVDLLCEYSGSPENDMDVSVGISTTPSKCYIITANQYDQNYGKILIPRTSKPICPIAKCTNGIVDAETYSYQQLTGNIIGWNGLFPIYDTIQVQATNEYDRKYGLCIHGFGTSIKQSIIASDINVYSGLSTPTQTTNSANMTNVTSKSLLSECANNPQSDYIIDTNKVMSQLQFQLSCTQNGFWQRHAIKNAFDTGQAEMPRLFLEPDPGSDQYDYIKEYNATYANSFHTEYSNIRKAFTEDYQDTLRSTFYCPPLITLYDYDRVYSGNTKWNATLEWTNASSTCDTSKYIPSINSTGQIVQPTRVCKQNGIWGPVQNPCGKKCPDITENNITWSFQNTSMPSFDPNSPNKTITGTCITPQNGNLVPFGSGTMDRMCNLLDGTWDVAPNKKCIIEPKCLSRNINGSFRTPMIQVLKIKATTVPSKAIKSTTSDKKYIGDLRLEFTNSSQYEVSNQNVDATYKEVTLDYKNLCTTTPYCDNNGYKIIDGYDNTATNQTQNQYVILTIKRVDVDDATMYNSITTSNTSSNMNEFDNISNWIKTLKDDNKNYTNNWQWSCGLSKANSAFITQYTNKTEWQHMSEPQLIIFIADYGNPYNTAAEIANFSPYLANIYAGTKNVPAPTSGQEANIKLRIPKDSNVFINYPMAIYYADRKYSERVYNFEWTKGASNWTLDAQPRTTARNCHSKFGGYIQHNSVKHIVYNPTETYNTTYTASLYCYDGSIAGYSAQSVDIKFSSTDEDTSAIKCLTSTSESQCLFNRLKATDCVNCNVSSKQTAKNAMIASNMIKYWSQNFLPDSTTATRFQSEYTTSDIKTTFVKDVISQYNMPQGRFWTNTPRRADWYFNRNGTDDVGNIINITVTDFGQSDEQDPYCESTSCISDMQKHDDARNQCFQDLLWSQCEGTIQ